MIFDSFQQICRNIRRGASRGRRGVHSGEAGGAAGTFLAGGLLYFNRDNPGVLVRSARGIAINLAQPAAYLWLAYLAGLVALAVWKA